MKARYDHIVDEMAKSGRYRIRAGRIETNRKWNGQCDVVVDWHVCDRDDGKGYRYVSYHMARVKAHRLAYILHHPVASLDGFEINHRNGNTLDISKRNLELCDAQRQSKHAYDIGLNRARGERHRLAKLTARKVRHARKLRAMKVPYVVIAEKYGVTWLTIKNACTGRTWAHVK